MSSKIEFDFKPQGSFLDELGLILSEDPRVDKTSLLGVLKYNQNEGGTSIPVEEPENQPLQQYLNYKLFTENNSIKIPDKYNITTMEKILVTSIISKAKIVIGNSTNNLIPCRLKIPYRGSITEGTQLHTFGREYLVHLFLNSFYYHKRDFGTSSDFLTISFKKINGFESNFQAKTSELMKLLLLPSDQLRDNIYSGDTNSVADGTGFSYKLTNDNTLVNHLADQINNKLTDHWRSVSLDEEIQKNNEDAANLANSFLPGNMMLSKEKRTKVKLFHFNDRTNTLISNEKTDLDKILTDIVQWNIDDLSTYILPMFDWENEKEYKNTKYPLLFELDDWIVFLKSFIRQTGGFLLAVYNAKDPNSSDLNDYRVHSYMLGCFYEVIETKTLKKSQNMFIIHEGSKTNKTRQSDQFLSLRQFIYGPIKNQDIFFQNILSIDTPYQNPTRYTLSSVKAEVNLWNESIQSVGNYPIVGLIHNSELNQFQSNSSSSNWPFRYDPLEYYLVIDLKSTKKFLDDSLTSMTVPLNFFQLNNSEKIVPHETKRKNRANSTLQLQEYKPPAAEPAKASSFYTLSFLSSSKPVTPITIDTPYAIIPLFMWFARSCRIWVASSNTVSTNSQPKRVFDLNLFLLGKCCYKNAPTFSDIISIESKPTYIGSISVHLWNLLCYSMRKSSFPKSSSTNNSIPTTVSSVMDQPQVDVTQRDLISAILFGSESDFFHSPLVIDSILVYKNRASLNLLNSIADPAYLEQRGSTTGLIDIKLYHNSEPKRNPKLKIDIIKMLLVTRPPGSVYYPLNLIIDYLNTQSIPYTNFFNIFVNTVKNKIVTYSDFQYANSVRPFISWTRLKQAYVPWDYFSILVVEYEDIVRPINQFNEYQLQIDLMKTTIGLHVQIVSYLNSTALNIYAINGNLLQNSLWARTIAGLILRMLSSIRNENYNKAYFNDSMTNNQSGDPSFKENNYNECFSSFVGMDPYHCDSNDEINFDKFAKLYWWDSKQATQLYQANIYSFLERFFKRRFFNLLSKNGGIISNTKTVVLLYLITILEFILQKTDIDIIFSASDDQNATNFSPLRCEELEQIVTAFSLGKIFIEYILFGLSDPMILSSQKKNSTKITSYNKKFSGYKYNQNTKSFSKNGDKAIQYFDRDNAIPAEQNIVLFLPSNQSELRYRWLFGKDFYKVPIPQSYYVKFRDINPHEYICHRFQKATTFFLDDKQITIWNSLNYHGYPLVDNENSSSPLTLQKTNYGKTKLYRDGFEHLIYLFYSAFSDLTIYSPVVPIDIKTININTTLMNSISLTLSPLDFGIIVDHMFGPEVAKSFFSPKNDAITVRRSRVKNQIVTSCVLGYILEYAGNLSVQTIYNISSFEYIHFYNSRTTPADLLPQWLKNIKRDETNIDYQNYIKRKDLIIPPFLFVEKRSNYKELRFIWNPIEDADDYAGVTDLDDTSFLKKKQELPPRKEPSQELLGQRLLENDDDEQIISLSNLAKNENLHSNRHFVSKAITQLSHYLSNNNITNELIFNHQKDLYQFYRSCLWNIILDERSKAGNDIQQLKRLKNVHEVETKQNLVQFDQRFKLGHRIVQKF